MRESTNCSCDSGCHRYEDEVGYRIEAKKNDLWLLEEAGQDNAGSNGTEGKSTSGRESEAVGIEIYAMFSVFGSIFGGISPIIGGLFVDYLPNVKHSFLATMIPNLVLLVFSVSFLKEKRQNTTFPKGRSLKEIFSGAFKVITGNSMLLPVLIVMLINLAPTMCQVISFVVINRMRWSYTQMGTVIALKTAFMAGF